MVKPYLVAVTGRPGAGKTTFAEKLSRAACLPMLSRDQLKEGYVRTQGVPNRELSGDVNRIVTDLFFETIEKLREGCRTPGGSISTGTRAWIWPGGAWSFRSRPMRSRGSRSPPGI